MMSHSNVSLPHVQCLVCFCFFFNIYLLQHQQSLNNPFFVQLKLLKLKPHILYAILILIYLVWIFSSLMSVLKKQIFFLERLAYKEKIT